MTLHGKSPPNPNWARFILLQPDRREISCRVRNELILGYSKTQKIEVPISTYYDICYF